MDTEYLTQSMHGGDTGGVARPSSSASPRDPSRRLGNELSLKMAFAAGCLTVIIAVAVMIGWHFHSIPLTSISSKYFPMTYATAVGFLLIGAALAVLAVRSGMPALSVPAVFAGIAAAYCVVVGGVVLLEYVAGRGFAIDKLFYWGYAGAKYGVLSRPAPNTALCMLLIGIAVFLCPLSNRLRFRWGTVAILSTVTASIGLIAASGYLFRITEFYAWSALSNMGIPTSIEFIVEGLGFLALAWGRQDRRVAHAPTWLPIPVGAAVATAMLSLFQLLWVHTSLVTSLIRPEARRNDLEQIHRLETFMPIVEFVVGLGVAFLVGWTVRLAQRASMQSTDLQSANARLIDEIAVRVRLEESLAKANEELDGRVRERTRELEETHVRLRQMNEELDKRVHERTSELQREQQFVKAVLDNTHAGVVACDANGMLTFFNPVAREYHRHGEEPLPPDQWSKYYGLFLPDGETELRTEQIPLYRALRGEVVSNVEVVVIDQDERPRLMEVSGQSMKDDDGHDLGAVVVMHDITERKRTEEALRESEERFKNAFENAPIGMALCGLQGQFLRVNKSLCGIVGYTEQEMLALDFQTITHPDDLKADIAQVDRLLSGEIQYYEMEKRYLHKDGHAVWILLSATLLRGDQGRPLYFIAQIQDISRRKGAEARLREQTHKLARSNAELEQFAYFASHDLQEPLRKVQTFSRLLETKYESALSEQAKDYIERMRSATSRMQQLIDDLLLLSRVSMQPQPFETVDLSATVREVVADFDMIVAATGAEIDVGDLPVVIAAPAQMRQLFRNLISNALKYQAVGNKPAVRIRAEYDGETCRIDLADNGIGFDPEYAERIFAPFQRLHGREEYEGTGIGLAICRKIVERHRGTITAHSFPGEGSTFTITLPITQPAGASNDEQAG